MTEFPGLDLAAWGASVLVFGAVMMFVTQFLKIRIRNKWPTVDSYWYTVVSFIVSLASSAVIYYTNNLTDPNFLSIPPPINWIAFGLVGGAVASGWYDLRKAT